MGNRWIPTTERLPNQREFIESYVRSAYAAEFLVTIEGADKATTLYYSQTGVWFDEQGEHSGTGRKSFSGKRSRISQSRICTGSS